MTYAKSIEIALQKTDSEMSDYDGAIFPAIIDTAQKTIAMYGKHIRRMYTIVKTVEEETPYNLPVLIEGFFQLLNVKERGNIEPVNYYAYGEETGFNIAITGKGTFDIYYYAMPETIDESTPITYEFEVSIETHNAIPYWIGYEITKNDDATVAQTCLNEWNKCLSLFSDTPKAEYKKIINRYEVR